MKSPRPAPRFYSESQTFSTKKERPTPRDHPPPRPPIKSAPPIRRFFPYKTLVQKAQAVSFRDSESSLLNKHYDEDSKDLYFDQCFTIESKLGCGSFGEVFKVKSKEDGKYYAVKKSKEAFRGESDRKRKLEEVAKHEKLPKHLNCIRFIKAWEERQHLYIQTELCVTSLAHLCESQHDIPESLIWNYLVDLLLAVKHLHDHDLIHLDIKPANIFISSDGICKLGDFGLVFDLTKSDISEAVEGDPKYLPPELLEGRFTKAADVFSLGITILELASDLDLPQGGDSWHKLRNGVIPYSITANMSKDLRNIIQSMMHPNPKIRPSVDLLLQSDMLKNVLNQRKKQLWLNFARTSIKEFMALLATYCGSFLYFLAYPLVHLYKRILPNMRKGNAASPESTPIPLVKQRIFSDWDYTYSDDEALDDSIFLHDDDDISFAPGNMTSSSGPVNSTPTRVFTPDSFAHRDWSSYRFSPIQGSHSTRHSPRNASRNSTTKFSIEPKNLTEMFNALGDD